jgi:hypothetical protein
VKRRRPLWACLLNLVMPGLGAAYAGEPLEALAMFLGYAFAWLLAARGVAVFALLPLIVVVVAIARTEVVVRRRNLRCGYPR